MGKFCVNCGKQLPFFNSIFYTHCHECQEKIAVEQKKANTENTDKKEKIQPHTEIHDVFSGSIGGKIEFYNLQEWWLYTLSAEERNIILTNFKPLGLNPDSLIHGKIKSSDQSAIQFLTDLSAWFKKPEYREIGYKMITKAESMISDRTLVFDKHFLYQTKMEIFYRNRDIDEFALPTAMEACKQQIAISTKAKKAFLKQWAGKELPSHAGYNQLCIIMKKQKNFDEVIRLAKEAKEQGWAGDWDKRIEKCKKKTNA